MEHVVDEKQTISEPPAADSSPTRSHLDLTDDETLSPSPARSPAAVSIEEKQTISEPPAADSSPTRSHLDLPDDETLSPSPARSPAAVSTAARSSISSDISHRSCLSHGSSPREPDEKTLVVTPMENPPGNSPEKPPTVVNHLYVKDEPVAATKMDPAEVRDVFTSGVVEEGGGGGGDRKRSRPPPLSILRRTKRDVVVKKAALGFRVFGMAFCLVSFAVMVADQNQGWALDSFQNYKEFRYSMSVSVIGFVYSGAQACYLAYHLATGKHISSNPLRYYIDFALDQVLTYLLISASSSASTRIDDWKSNWGKDKFPDMASASVAMSFLAFVALASSSLISGYVLCTFKST